jgi:hypothetical protein
MLVSDWIEEGGQFMGSEISVQYLWRDGPAWRECSIPYRQGRMGTFSRPAIGERTRMVVLPITFRGGGDSCTMAG